MKNKGKGHFRIYILLLFFLCLVLDDILSGFYDFCVGFYAGFNGLSPEWGRTNEIAENLRRYDWVAVVLIAVLVCCIFYNRMKHKVVKPIEQLTESMEKVSQGNLDVRVPVAGAFEFGQMEESFNYMVEELDNAQRNKEVLEKRNQQLYAGIAHDLKTPMTMIKGYAKVLESEETISEADRKRFLKTIIEQTDHANSLLDSLLSYSKLQNQSYQLKREKKDIAECLRTCVADYYSVLEQADMQLELLIPEKRVEFCFDEVELKRVFINLLSNTAKHNPKKTTGIIQLEENAVLSDGTKAVRIVIADNGPKIPKELQDTLFEPFAVGDASRNTQNGSGLGLSISKKIVERHDGTIRYVENWKEGYKGFIIEMKQR